ncbi:biotin--[acetyl-CoA-carboxylase] ligase [Sphingomicrobium astaxanthinifaciens]|uniref:biotin--[acetyl-CoA-carboxylase] ligase n=1 Tax=Sphingomicrobium astaxanthinifaciens TaxID=1227949 RepID=UPI002ACE05EA|nr:biotin--[acetyl-CoA-carboxylase] ligase [Sphingomicrobium astaxanthinifaciens]
MDVTGSTNSDLGGDPAAVEGDWLVARRQEAGRGRQGREWQSLDGNFFGSTLVELKPGDPETATLSLVAGLALVDAIDLAAPQAGPMLKWPNDLMLDGAKLAGILLERSGDRVVAGFGVNLAVAPAIEGRETIALAEHVQMAPQAFAPLLAGAFSRMLAAWRQTAPSALSMAWLQRGHPVGTPLTVHDGEGRAIAGRFAGLEEDGAMRLDTGEAIEVIRAGDVMLAPVPDA